MVRLGARRIAATALVLAASSVPVVAAAPAGQAADPPLLPVVTSASLKITDHFLNPKAIDDHQFTVGELTLQIEMPPRSGIADADTAFQAPKRGCYEGLYEPTLAGSVVQDGTHATVKMPIATCGTFYEPYPDNPGAYELGFADTRPGAFHGVYLDWGDNAPRSNWLPAPANVWKFHIWSVTRISESTNVMRIKGVRYRNLAGVLQGWDAPNERWKRFARGKVSLFFTPPGGTPKWVASKDTASDGSYHFRTSNTKAGTWRVYFRTSVHFWTSSRSVTVS